MQIGFQGDQQLFGFADFFHGHFTHVRVVVLEQCLGTLQIILYAEQLFISGDDRLDFGVFLGISAKSGLIGNDFSVAKQRSQFLESVLEDVQLVEQ